MQNHTQTSGFVARWFGPVRASLARRISLWVILCVVGVLVASISIGNFLIKKSVKLEESIKANGILHIVGQHLDTELISVEVAVRNHIVDIKENLDNPEALYRITQRVLEDNPGIVGSAIAFSPNFFPEKGQWFAPYAYREDKTIKTKQLGSADYNYHEMEWYQTADSLKRDYWSEPYFDKGGGEGLMTTYSCPLFDDNGHLIAVLTADILLEHLSEFLGINYYKNAYACLLGRTGSFISHPSQEKLTGKTIYSIAKETGQSELKELANKLNERKSGALELNTETYGKSYVFYVPFEHTGWTLAIVCQSSELFANVYKMEFLFIVPFFFIMLLLAYLVNRGVHRLVEPLTQFAQAVDEVAEGNLQAQLPEIKSKDEMQRLHHSFSLMQTSLAKQMEELKAVNAAKGRMEGELKVACDIQQSMLPKPYKPTDDTSHIDIYGHQTSAKEVGGDLYDFFFRGDKLFFCIGDVSGKGVPAALIMSTTLSQFRNVSNYEEDLEKIIAPINKSASEGNESCMFITFFVGVLDLNTGLVRYLNAGHNKPFIVSDTVTELPAKPNFPLGIDEGACYAVREFTLEEGDTLLLYTDGLTEAMNADEEMFGIERVESQLKREYDCKSQIQDLLKAVHQYVGDAPQSDDLTLLAIKRNKK